MAPGQLRADQLRGGADAGERLLHPLSSVRLLLPGIGRSNERTAAGWAVLRWEAAELWMYVGSVCELDASSACVDRSIPSRRGREKINCLPGVKSPPGWRRTVARKDGGRVGIAASIVAWPGPDVLPGLLSEERLFGPSNQGAK